MRQRLSFTSSFAVAVPLPDPPLKRGVWGAGFPSSERIAGGPSQDHPLEEGMGGGLPHARWPQAGVGSGPLPRLRKSCRVLSLEGEGRGEGESQSESLPQARMDASLTLCVNADFPTHLASAPVRL